MGPADALSHKDKVPTDDDNREITMLRNNEQYFHVRALDLALQDEISHPSTTDPIITKILSAMNKEDESSWIPQTTCTDWKFDDRKLYFKGQLYIPENACHELIKTLHELPMGGHEGFFRTLHCLQRDYWWPGMSTFL